MPRSCPTPFIPPHINGSARRRPRIAFTYYGGKSTHLDFILPLLPTRYRHYCEPFGGSAAVLLNRTPAPLETYNDLDGEVVNFFACLRAQPGRLIRLLRHTPYGRQELRNACLTRGRCRPQTRVPSTLPPYERARRFFVRARQAFNGLAQTASPGQWSYTRQTSHRGMSASVSKWQSGIEGLTEIAERLRRVQLEHAPAIEVIRRFDTPDTMFYCDPPYPSESRRSLNAYAYEMTDRDHEELAQLLHAVKGAVAVSGYRCPLMDRLYRGWRRADAPPRWCHASGSPRRESLWMNYDPKAE